MTRKHFQAIADAVRIARHRAERHHLSAEEALDAVAQLLTYVMSDDNPRFDTERSLRACAKEGK